MTPETYARAVELDDDFPLDVCPGCRRDLSEMPRGHDHLTPEQWEKYQWRYWTADRSRPYTGGDTHVPRLASPFSSPGTSQGPRCEWTADLLVARHKRRVWRLEYEAHA